MALLNFVDGGIPVYARPALIIEIDSTNDRALVLNVSSTTGKEHKLFYPSEQWVSFIDLQKYKLMDNGKTLCGPELSNILKELNAYKRTIKTAI